jgi:hypothetical protein
VEVDSKIFLLDAQLKIREDDELLYISFAELKQWTDARSIVNSAFKVHQSAVIADSIERFESAIGSQWDGGVRKTGKAKHTAAARQEEREARQHTSQRKSS